jgi:hypothetical protein
MSRWEQLAPVVVALGVSLAITAVLGTGMLSGGGGNDTVDIQRDQNRTPAPTTNTTPTGGSPEAVTEFAAFENVADERGFRYESTATSDSSTDSGLYVVDYDNDGDEDLLAIGSGTPTLFANTGGTFERARTFDHGDARTAHFLDYNNNGWRDLVVATYDGSIVLYENDNGTFQRQNGVAEDVAGYNGYPVSMTSADVTGNGCLDIFVGMYGIQSGGTPPVTRDHAHDLRDNHPTVRPDPVPATENHLLYGVREDGTCKRLVEASDQAGIEGKNWTLATSAADFTGDGHVDIHVGNDFDSDVLYENRGNGTFERHLLGPATDRNAMSSVARDINGDGRLDLFVTNIYFPDNVGLALGGFDIAQVAPLPKGNNLLINQGGEPGEGLFADTAPEHGLNEGGWGWAAAVEDFTNDGHLDIIHSTGASTPVEPYGQFRAPQVWQGTADSWEHVNGSQIGLETHQGRGLVSLDYNSDGVLDVAVATTPFDPRERRSGTASFRLYENQLESDASLQLFVRNPGGIERNAAVIVETDRRTIVRGTNANGDYLSQNSRLIHVGTATEKIEQVRVLWPDGTESTYDDLQEGNRYVLTPGESRRVGT